MSKFSALKISVLACMLCPLLSAAEFDQNAVFNNCNQNLDRSSSEQQAMCSKRKPKSEKSVFSTEILQFTAEGMDRINNSGSIFKNFFSTLINIPVIQMPSTATNPAASIGFKIPLNFISHKKLSSSLSIQFLTDTDVVGTGNVQFLVTADIAQSGQTIPGDASILSTNLGTTQPVNVKNATVANTANYYTTSIQIARGVFKVDSFVYLAIARNNSISGNYSGCLSCKHRTSL